MTALNHDAIVSAGLDIVRHAGWDGLSLRAVAADLDVTPMALYRHVPDSAALHAAVMTRIAGALQEVRDSGAMLGDLEWWARQAHAGLLAFPGAGGRLLVTWFEVVPALRAVDGLLAVVQRGGLQGFEAVAAVNAVFMYVLMRAEAEQTVRRADVVERSLASLDRTPRLAALASHYATARFDLHFEYGLQVLLSGIEARRGSVV